MRLRRKWLWCIAPAIGVLLFVALAPMYLWKRLPSLTTENDASVSELFRTEAEHDQLFSWTQAPILKATHPSGGALYYFGTCHTPDAEHPVIEKFTDGWREFEPTIALLEQRMGLYFGGVRPAVGKFGESAAVYELGRALANPAPAW